MNLTRFSTFCFGRNFYISVAIASKRRLGIFWQFTSTFQNETLTNQDNDVRLYMIITLKRIIKWITINSKNLLHKKCYKIWKILISCSIETISLVRHFHFRMYQMRYDNTSSCSVFISQFLPIGKQHISLGQVIQHYKSKSWLLLGSGIDTPSHLATWHFFRFLL